MPVERTTGGTSLIDVLDRVLDKGIVIDAWVRVSLVGIDLITVEARVVVASIDTYIKYSEVGRQRQSRRRGPAVDSKTHEAVLAENQALRAQLEAATTGNAPAPAAPPSGSRSGLVRGPRWRSCRRPGASRRRRARSGSSCWSSSSRRTTSWSAPSGRWSGWPPTPASAMPCARPSTRATRTSSVLAGHGLGTLPAGDLRVELEQRGHPLVSVLTRLQPTVIPQNGYTDAIGIPQVPYLAVPLHSPVVDDEPRLGVLLVSPMLPRVVREARWVADVLGPRIAHLRAYRGYAESQRRLDRDRNLLQAVIDAVSDPILLTDTEGRMLIANNAAERLFAAKEGESEGRQRAVALNNMLFSAALSWSAAAPEPLRRELLLVDPNEGADLLFELISALVDRHDARHGRRVDPQERHRPPARHRGDRGELPAPARHRGRDARRARPPQPHHRLRRRPDSRDRRRRRDHHDERPRGAALHAAQGRARRGRAPRRRQRRPLLVVRRQPAVRAARRCATAATSRSPSPSPGRTNPFEAVAGKILSEHGELIGVVTILHDKAEALERERLYEQLKLASSELEDKVRGGDRRARPAERAPAPPAHPARAGLGAEVAVPREHVARVPHAAERDPRLHEHAAPGRRGRRDGAAAEAQPRARGLERAPSHGDHQRHPRHLPHRGGQDAAARHGVQARRPHRRGHGRGGADHRAHEAEGGDRRRGDRRASSTRTARR